MIELHLIGYTEDAEELVLDLDADGEGRYTVRIDPDLLATVAQLREVRIRRGAPVDLRPDTAEPPRHAPAPGPEPDPAPEPEPARAPGREPAPRLERPAARAPVLAPAPRGERRPPPAPLTVPTNGRRREGGPPTAGRSVPLRARPSAHRASDAPAEEPLVTEEAVDTEPAHDHGVEPDRTEHRPAALAVPHAKLSPAEIQAQLRAGRSVRAVAAEAGTDPTWIERWLPPILAERERVLDEARRRRLDAPRARPLGVSVDRALADRGVPDDRRSWSATRRADGRWRVSVRFEDRGRPRTATWLMDPAGERVQAASPLAEQLAGPGSRSTSRR